jgi:hypothetical protein
MITREHHDAGQSRAAQPIQHLAHACPWPIGEAEHAEPPVAHPYES